MGVGGQDWTFQIKPPFYLEAILICEFMSFNQNYLNNHVEKCMRRCMRDSRPLLRTATKGPWPVAEPEGSFFSGVAVS
jgi:hypothetical protein